MMKAAATVLAAALLAASGALAQAPITKGSFTERHQTSSTPFCLSASRFSM